MKNDKTPGPDGIPADLYKVFWPRISIYLYKMLETAMATKEMPFSSQQGVLNLIPKPGKDSRLLKNLRPITLLNVDYKIMEKVISNRMMDALHYLIHEDQTGFMPGRRISINIRKILDIMDTLQDNDEPGLLLSIDYQKVFDKIEIRSALGAMNYFNFNPKIIDWVHTLYSNFYLKIQNNGNFSEEITVSRGLHQGECCSTAIFLVVAELLAIEIRKKSEIKGIPVADIENVLGQFADDTDMTLQYHKETLDCVLNTMEFFRLNTGCSINYDKTRIYRLGSVRHTNAKLVTQKELAWTNEPVNILGIWIDHNVDRMLELNYYPLLEKAKKIMGLWSNRQLSLIGKIEVVNTLIMSLFTYRMTVLPNIPENFVKQLESEISNFYMERKETEKLS